MSVKQHSCISIICDGCGDPYQDFEGYSTIHLDNAQEFIDSMADYETEPEYLWTTEGDKHYCPTCSCERQTGHGLTERIGFSSYCRCGAKWERGA